MASEVDCFSFEKKCLKEGEMHRLSPVVSLFPCRRSRSSLLDHRPSP